MTRMKLQQILDRFRDEGRVADLWLRDDDAVEPTAALEKFLQTAQQFEVPVTLAVIPAPTGHELADWLESRPRISVAVHGYAHINHAPAGEKKRELGLHREQGTVVAELIAGYEKLHSLHGKRFVPMLVPPWNRIDAAVAEALANTDYRAISVFGPEKPSSLTAINTHVDPIDWHGTRGCRDHDTLFAELAARLETVLKTGGTAGFLTHHLVHDKSLEDFLSRLFDVTAGHSGCRWCDSRNLVSRAIPESDALSAR